MDEDNPVAKATDSLQESRERTARPPIVAALGASTRDAPKTEDLTDRRTFDVKQHSAPGDDFPSTIDVRVVDSSGLATAAVLVEAKTTSADGNKEILRSVLELKLELRSDSGDTDHWKGRLDLSGLPDSHDGQLTLTIKCLPSELHLLGTTRNALGDLLPIVNYASLPVRQMSGTRYEFSEPSGELLKMLTDGKAASLTFALKVADREVQP